MAAARLSLCICGGANRLKQPSVSAVALAHPRLRPAKRKRPGAGSPLPGQMLQRHPARGRVLGGDAGRLRACSRPAAGRSVRHRTEGRRRVRCELTLHDAAGAPSVSELTPGQVLTVATSGVPVLGSLTRSLTVREREAERAAARTTGLLVTLRRATGTATPHAATWSPSFPRAAAT